MGKKPSYVKAFIDPDLIEEWKKFQKKFPYLFWVRAMNIKDEKEWREFIKGKEPDLECPPVSPGNAREFAEVAAARRNAYFYIARSFSEPSQGLVDHLLGGDFPSDLVASLGAFVPESKTKEGLKLLKGYLNHVKDVKPEKLLEKLRDEHLTIFYDSFFPWLSCYESVYRGEKQIMGELTAMVKESYNNAGFSLTGKYGNDPPDDAKIELEFMYRLCEEELEAWRRGDTGAAIGCLEMQRKHLYQHLIEWIPFLCDDLMKPEFREGLRKKFHRTIEVRENSTWEFDFYKAVGMITKGLLECDYSQVQAMLETGKLDEGKISSYLKETARLDSRWERFALAKVTR